MSQSSGFTPATFTFFSRLPLEVQIMIYKFMILRPRRVHMTFKGGLPTRLGSNAPIPAVLHLNRDARHEALKYYKLHFGTDSCEPDVYFNPRIDVLYFGPEKKPWFRLRNNEDSQLQHQWLCQEGIGSSSALCRKGCGHHELLYFLKNIAKGCAGTLSNIGIDLRLTQADFLLFFDNINVFASLKKIQIYYQRAEDLGLQDTIRGSEFFGLKWWLICSFEKRFQRNVKVERIPVPIDRPQYRVQNFRQAIPWRPQQDELDRRARANQQLLNG